MTRSSRNRYTGRNPHARGLHVVALFEGAKGLLVLLVGCGLLTFIHRDVHEAALRLVEHLHLNPASHYPQVFLDLTERLNDTRLWSMAIAAAVYSAVRMVEAVGLWLRKSWAEWFALLDAAGAADLDHRGIVAVLAQRHGVGPWWQQMVTSAYEKARAGTAAKVVRTNREHPPDFINIRVEELVGDRPFDDLDKFITQDELRALSDNYKRIAGFALSDVAKSA